MKTAEWQCQACGATNRKLVSPHAKNARDRCVSCHREHTIGENERPVRWDSRLSA